MENSAPIPIYEMNFRSESIDTVNQVFMVANIPLGPLANVSPGLVRGSGERQRFEPEAVICLATRELYDYKSLGRSLGTLAHLLPGSVGGSPQSSAWARTRSSFRHDVVAC
jgi:hypothetical protein